MSNSQGQDPKERFLFMSAVVGFCVDVIALLSFFFAIGFGENLNTQDIQIDLGPLGGLWSSTFFRFVTVAILGYAFFVFIWGAYRLRVRPYRKSFEDYHYKPQTDYQVLLYCIVAAVDSHFYFLVLQALLIFLRKKRQLSYRESSQLRISAEGVAMTEAIYWAFIFFPLFFVLWLRVFHLNDNMLLSISVLATIGVLVTMIHLSNKRSIFSSLTTGVFFSIPLYITFVLIGYQGNIFLLLFFGVVFACIGTILFWVLHLLMSLIFYAIFSFSDIFLPLKDQRTVRGPF